MKQGHHAMFVRHMVLGAMTLAIGLATLMLAGATFSSEAAAQITAPPLPKSQPRDQPRDRAPIGHRQPRPQDLPPGVVRGENGTSGTTAEERALDKKLEICRGC